jgi:hypothetical protein
MFRITTVVMVLGVGCTGELVEPHHAVLKQEVASCQEFMCGTNSPEIAEFGFWELNAPSSLAMPGLPNNVGLQLEAFVHGTDYYVPRVHAGRLTAHGMRSDGTVVTLAGPALVDGWLKLRVAGRVFKLVVNQVGSVESWAQPTTRRPPVVLETYQLDWAEMTNGGWREGGNVCSHPPDRESGEALTMTGPYMFHTLLFEGDRINAGKKTIDAIDASWFNLGCAGHALAKLALTGHTEAAHNAGAFTTTVLERQAMLKLLVADYCGDGTAFTVAGQPLNWRDDGNTMKLKALTATPPQPLWLEARWTDQGAACLDKPRVDAHWTQLGDDVFGPNVYAQVQAHCPMKMPPHCADSSLDTAGYHLLSATVPYQP